MKNPICISTGCLSELFEDRNNMIEKLRKFSPFGIELSFAYPKYLLEFDISENNLEYLRNLKFNSIHAPSGGIIYGENKESKEVLQKISELYKKINARNVVFHKGKIENYDLIANSDFVSSIENGDWKKPKHSIEDIKDVLDKNKDFKFTFDFAHALSVSSSDIPEYINYFKDRLIEIHLSIINEDSKEHDFLHENNNKETKKLLRSLKTVSVPVVLECLISNLKEVELIKKEMEYIRKI